MVKITGTNLPDIIFGTDKNDEIFVLAGNDTIIGSLEDDFIDGGKNTDTVNYHLASRPFAIALLPQGVVRK